MIVLCQKTWRETAGRQGALGLCDPGATQILTLFFFANQERILECVTSTDSETGDPLLS